MIFHIMIEFNGRQITTDEEGYLKNWRDWSLELVPELAKREPLDLTAAHWQAVLFVREFYLEFNTSPAMRMLIKAMQKKFGSDNVTSCYLQQLFPKGPAKQATRLAGLPKPVKCL